LALLIKQIKQPPVKDSPIKQEIEEKVQKHIQDISPGKEKQRPKVVFIDEHSPPKKPQIQPRILPIIA
jgi:hypothetical protein